MRAMHVEEFLHNKPALRDKMGSHFRRLRSILGQAFDEGVRKGAIRKGLSVELLDCALLGSLQARDMRRDREGVEIPIVQLVDLFLDGASPRARGR